MRLTFIPLAFFAGAIASRLMLAGLPQRFALDVAQPIAVVTWWGSTGTAFLLVLTGAVVVAGITYVLALRDDVRTTPVVLGATAAALIAALIWLPLFSSDVYAYAAYGEMLRTGANPYAHVVVSSDAVVSAAQWQWSGNLPMCVYGPAFVAIAATLIAVLHATPLDVQIGAFRALSAVAFLACVALVARAGEDHDRERGRKAALMLGLNPIALWAAAEGHNDTLMLAVALSGVVLYRRNAVAGAVLAGLGGAIKAPAALCGIALAATTESRKRLMVMAAGIAAAAIVLIASAPLLYAASHDIAPHGRYAPYASVQSLHPLIALAVAIALLVRLRSARTIVDRYLLLGLTAWLAIPNPYPWYSLWLLPLVAWSSDRQIRNAALLVTAASILRYIPDAVGIPNPLDATLLGLAALAAYAPLLPRAIIGRS